MITNGERIAESGWLFAFSQSVAPELRARLIEVGIAAVRGTGVRRIRRSRHAASYVANLKGADRRDDDVFIKVLDPPRGLDAFKKWFRRSGVWHVAAITAALNREGFATPRILMLGTEAESGREMIVTARVAGTLLPRNLAMAHDALTHKRKMLRALGATVARMHRAGYLHGDLTPYNVFVASDLTFTFIDHERTRRTLLSRFERPRLRNLVQLGRFDLRGLSNTDRMRVWCGYAAELAPKSRRASRRRVAALLAARISRDRSTAEMPADVARSWEIKEG
jgi:lipopolysaccharide kinase (Kdo/WaaP) family protein